MVDQAPLVLLLSGGFTQYGKTNLNLRWSDVSFVGGFSLRQGPPTLMRLAVGCVAGLGLLCLVGHFGWAVRRNHEQNCLGSSVANLTCRSCGTPFLHMQARRLRERASLRRHSPRWFRGFVLVLPTWPRSSHALRGVQGIGPLNPQDVCPPQAFQRRGRSTDHLR